MHALRDHTALTDHTTLTVDRDILMKVFRTKFRAMFTEFTTLTDWAMFTESALADWASLFQITGSASHPDPHMHALRDHTALTVDRDLIAEVFRTKFRAMFTEFTTLADWAMFTEFATLADWASLFQIARSDRQPDPGDHTALAGEWNRVEVFWAMFVEPADALVDGEGADALQGEGSAGFAGWATAHVDWDFADTMNYGVDWDSGSADSAQGRGDGEKQWELDHF